MNISMAKFDSRLGAWSDSLIRRGIYIMLPLVVVVLYVYSQFILVIERRAGVVLDDPVLKLFVARDFTWAIFFVIYGGIILGTLVLIARPRLLLSGLRAYVVMMTLRMAMLYLAPFNPPHGAIPLIDPLAGGTVGATLMNDLFFSGHTATMFLLFLTLDSRALKTLFLFCTIAVGSMLLAQHVHYTLDVIVAPIVAYASVRIVVWLEHHWRNDPAPRSPNPPPYN